MRKQEFSEEEKASMFLLNVAERGKKLKKTLTLGKIPEVVMDANTPTAEDEGLVPRGMGRLAYYAAQLGISVKVVKEDESCEYPWDENGNLKAKK